LENNVYQKMLLQKQKKLLEVRRKYFVLALFLKEKEKISKTMYITLLTNDCGELTTYEK